MEDEEVVIESGQMWSMYKDLCPTHSVMLDFFDSNEALDAFATLVLLKVLFMGPLTSYRRTTLKVFANLEDAGENDEAKKVVRTHEDVERVRRCHQNDLENVLPVLGIGLMYGLSNPDPFMVKLHFRLFLLSRVAHTLAYLHPLPPPSRSITWILGLGSTLSMAFSLLLHGLTL